MLSLFHGDRETDGGWLLYCPGNWAARPGRAGRPLAASAVHLAPQRVLPTRFGWGSLSTRQTPTFRASHLQQRAGDEVGWRVVGSP